jgi:hypothetical protein
MPIRCKSCGYINKEGVKNCERCSFDLKYSIIFDKAIKSEQQNPKMLFDIEQDGEFDIEEGHEFDIFPEYKDENETQHIKHDGNIAADSQSFSEHESTTSEQTDNSYSNYNIPEEKNYNPEQKTLIITLSVEALIFMVIHLFFYLLTKLLFPTLNIQNSTLITVTMFFYMFVLIYSVVFKGKILSLVLLEKSLNQK